MHKVHFFEEKCCASSTGDRLAELLAKHFGGEVTVSSHDLRNPTEAVPLPAALLLKLDMGESGCLPAMVVDSAVVTEGWLPTFDEAVQLVETGQPLAVARRSPGQAEHGCCGTGQSCCG